MEHPLTADGGGVAEKRLDAGGPIATASALGGLFRARIFLDVVWGYASYPSTRTVDTHIAKLRSKLEGDDPKHKWIETIHGLGYRLNWDNKSMP